MNDCVRVLTFMSSSGKRYNIMGVTLEDEEGFFDYLTFEDISVDSSLAYAILGEEYQNLSYYKFLIDRIELQKDKIIFEGIIINNLDYCESRDDFYFFIREDEEAIEYSGNLSMSAVDYDINELTFNYYVKEKMIDVDPNVLEYHGIIPRLRLYEYNKDKKKLELKACRF